MEIHLVNLDSYTNKARSYLEKLCSVKPNRRAGSSGNREATAFFANTVRPFGFEIDATPFECLDYLQEESLLVHGDQRFEVYISPYSLGCDVRAELIAISTLEELERSNCVGKILLMKGSICSEQLMPKNFVFYNPQHHQEIIALLERQNPAGLITATRRNPEQVGALYPYPLFVDGDFNIPSVYCKDSVGEQLINLTGETFQLMIQSQRLPSRATNVIARRNQGAPQKVVITAHIDAYEDTPGASDNASGTVVLLLLAEMISDYEGDLEIEIAALNGEDHYSAGGEMDYIDRYGDEFNRISCAINVDDVGYKKGRTSYSFYECSMEFQHEVEGIFQDDAGLVQGEPWFNGDHMLFVQRQIPSIAFTSECMPELMRTVTHTALDTPDIINDHKLVDIAESINKLVGSL